MIDERIHTFLTLCDVMNYRKTAALRNMTQPAVTQHIKYLEAHYGCKLFVYEAKVLRKTDEALRLQAHARSMLANEKGFQQQVNAAGAVRIAVGATKTIGEFIMRDAVLALLRDEHVALTVVVDNTAHLFEQLHTFQLDFLMIEGYFDKAKYDYQPIREEELIGICAPNHPFANRAVALEEVFCAHVLLREQGSGTRAVFERFLQENNHSFAAFARVSTLSSFHLIQQAVEENIAISFVYESIARQNKNLAVFKVKTASIRHELNYVFLKDTQAHRAIAAIAPFIAASELPL